MILVLETSTAHGHLALLDSQTGETVRETTFAATRLRNAVVFPALQEVLRGFSSPLTDIVVGTGPGSYTGVRVAISAALGFSLAHECPAIGLPSLVSLAPDALVVGDARRSTYYTAEVRDHELVESPRIHDEASFREALRQTRLPLVTLDATPPLDLAEIKPRLPSAVTLGRLALRLSAPDRHQRSREPLEPLYLQAPYVTHPKRRSSYPD